MDQMSIYISLLRAINVSGQNRIRMPDLKVLYETLGLARVETYVQSGNVIFESDRLDSAGLEKLIEAQILKTMGFDVPVLIRTLPELQRMLDAHPFTPQQLADPSRIAAVFLRSDPGAELAAHLQLPGESPDWFRLEGREVYLYCPDGFGRTKLTNAFFEKKLQAAATSRNWKTVNTLLDIAKSR
jgi:uncharacterized protein (DUF1697 family)